MELFFYDRLIPAVVQETGVQAHPKNFALLEIREKFLNIWAESMKIRRKSLNI